MTQTSKRFVILLGALLLAVAVGFGFAEAASTGKLLDLSSPVSFPVDI